MRRTLTVHSGHAPSTYKAPGASVGTLQASRTQPRQPAQQLETLGRLTSGVAHELNNLVTIMAGYSAMLVRHLDPNDPLYEAAEGIQKASAWGASLSRQLTAFCHNRVIDVQLVDLNACVTTLKKILQRVLGEDITLITQLDTGTAPIWADPGQIEQSILNLAINARDAMPLGGTLTITTEQVTLAAHDASMGQFSQTLKPGPHVRLSVHDTGCGIHSELVSRLFTPFVTTKRPGDGTGLGLTIVHDIVTNSCGAIRVDSKPGQGTTFEVLWPCVEGEAEAHRAATSDTPTSGSETILLVEDEEPVRTLVRRILTQHGYTVLEASHGETALWASARHKAPIHLLITDVVLPHMSGNDLARCLHLLRPDMNVLYMSGYPKSAHFPPEVMDRTTAFLSKPFTPATLVHQVRKALDVSHRNPVPA